MSDAQEGEGGERRTTGGRDAAGDNYKAGVCLWKLIDHTVGMRHLRCLLSEAQPKLSPSKPLIQHSVSKSNICTAVWSSSRFLTSPSDSLLYLESLESHMRGIFEGNLMNLHVNWCQRRRAWSYRLCLRRARCMLAFCFYILLLSKNELCKVAPWEGIGIAHLIKELQEINAPLLRRAHACTVHVPLLLCVNIHKSVCVSLEVCRC